MTIYRKTSDSKNIICLQGMDIYSNILYVKEAFASLSHLAHRASMTDKYRPETACIIGNYYSLKGQHEKVLLPHSCSIRAVTRAAMKLSLPVFQTDVQALALAGWQAVMYFKRALALDRACLSAWTLMGHEYVEMKNPPAAIGALLMRPLVATLPLLGAETN